MKITDNNYKQSKGKGSYVEHNRDDSVSYKRGHFYSPKGIVDVYADQWKGKYFINMSFVFNGVHYSRSISNAPSINDKALSTRANQFVKSLFI